jgi:hypothetical protein
MEWICFWELTGLEKVSVIGVALIALVFFCLGLSMFFQKELWEGPLSIIKYKEWSLGVPAPLAVAAVGAALIVGEVWWLQGHFPSNNLSFSQKEWTLGEVQERLQRDSRIRIELQGDSASFRLDRTRNFSGACIADLLSSICDAYPAKLKCERPDSTTFVISATQ